MKTKTHTITVAWLAGRTFLEEVEGWESGDRTQQHRAVPGHRCACGNVYRPGQQVAVTHGTSGGHPHFWATCDNCGTFMF